jgi:ubiquinol-cytochrome c reductase cytochrome c1 subunit
MKPYWGLNKMKNNFALLFLGCALLFSATNVFAQDEHVQEPAATTEAAETQTAPPESAPAHAEGESGTQGHAEANVEHQHWHFDGMFGTYDKASMQRGLKVYREVCAACHSLNRISFRNLEDLGYEEGQVKNIASQYNVTDGPNDDGEMFERPALPSDAFPSPYPNEKAAKAMNNGALPPDLSLIIKARHHGPDYVYGILTGYEPAPEGTTLLEGQYWNRTMPGHIIAMPQPMQDGQVVYEDEAAQTVHQYAYDVVNFLTWASDPNMEQRKRTGIKVLIFLAVFAGIMYAVKRKIWADVH